jgi:hypothetical protein
LKEGESLKVDMKHILNMLSDKANCNKQV